MAEVDLLVLRACEEGFGCGFGETSITNGTIGSVVTTTIVEHDKDIDFGWDPGVRVGIGHDFVQYGDWTTGLFWTWFYEKDNSRTGSNKADWELHFNTFDWVFGRKLGYCSCFDLKPLGGFRFALIKQQLNTNLQTSFATASGTSFISTQNRDKQSFWGFGPELGLEVDWYFACGFSLYGNVDGALLYGHYKTTFNDTDSGALVANICHSTAESGACQFVLDLSLGLRWENE